MKNINAHREKTLRETKHNFTLICFYFKTQNLNRILKFGTQKSKYQLLRFQIKKVLEANYAKFNLRLNKINNRFYLGATFV